MPPRPAFCADTVNVAAIASPITIPVRDIAIPFRPA
jgi:hypothetical protein